MVGCRAKTIQNWDVLEFFMFQRYQILPHPVVSPALNIFNRLSRHYQVWDNSRIRFDFPANQRSQQSQSAFQQLKFSKSGVKQKIKDLFKKFQACIQHFPTLKKLEAVLQRLFLVSTQLGFQTSLITIQSTKTSLEMFWQEQNTFLRIIFCNASFLMTHKSWVITYES